MAAHGDLLGAEGSGSPGALVQGAVLRVVQGSGKALISHGTGACDGSDGVF